MRDRRSIRIPRGFASVLALGLLAGVLIWAKLRLSTDIPRSAIADPEERRVDDADATEDPDQGDE